MNEQGKFEIYKNKLQGLCDEHNLVYRFKKDRYPITLTFQTAGGLDGQMSMLEAAEDDGYRSPDATLMFASKDGELVYRISETFTIGDALFNKLKNLFKNMHSLWLQFFFRDLMERSALTENQMPVINTGDESSAASNDDDFDEMEDALENLESLEDDEDGEDGEDGEEA